MANPEHVKILKQGVEVWNRWRRENPDIKPDLKSLNHEFVDLNNINFFEADLKEANLWQSNLEGADLEAAICEKANFGGVNLRNAILCDADLNHARLASADLTDADAVQVNLIGADLVNTILNRANLAFASFANTRFCNLNLKSTFNIQSCIHHTSSIVDINTIYLSEGQIPEVFLRGCGVPESFITYMKSLTMSPIEYYSCFISHSTKDAEFAERLHSDLQNKAVRCWYAPEDMIGGEKIYTQIDEAIKVHDKLVLILSESSINSPWVVTEMKRTRKHEKQDQRQRLFPISLMPYDELKEWELFDADTGTDMAAEVRSYFIPDFSNWKNHDSYKKAFKRLLKDLKAGE